jgi:hypothetical protein
VTTFRATVKLGGKTATGIVVPEKVVTALGTSKRPAVVVTIGTYTYRTTIAKMGGDYMIPLSAENRTAAGVAAGDKLDVGVELDTKPREVEVPADLAKALGARARKRFDALAYSHRKEWVRSVEDAKTPETRARRIAKAVDATRAAE